MPTCRSCGVEVTAGATTCPVCHTAVMAERPNYVVPALTYLIPAITGVIFLYLEPYDKDELVRFHARQSIAFGIAWLAFNIVCGVFVAVLPRAIGGLFIFIEDVGNIGLAILWVFLMYQAYIGERFRVPLVADWAESLGL